MFKNLEAEMARKNITRQDIADLLDISYNTARNKINGNHKFYFDEAWKIRGYFFPNLELEYLFETENQNI